MNTKQNIIGVLGIILIASMSVAIAAIVGCSANISGSLGTEWFYSDHNVIGGKPVTDPRKGKFHAGFSRNFGAGQEEKQSMGAIGGAK